MASPLTSPIQDLYPDDVAHCFGCGRDNAHGHHLKSYVQGESVVARFTPERHHLSVPGFVYGGLLASLADCQAMATAAAAEMAESGNPAEGPAPRYVTAALCVDYVKPTPIGVELEIQSQVQEQSERKKVVAVTISTAGTVTVRAEVVAVKIPKSMAG